MPEWTGDGSLWFMDYRNADGSLAEMCGNGVRVFVRYLLEHDLASGPTVSHRDPFGAPRGHGAGRRPDPGRRWARSPSATPRSWSARSPVRSSRRSRPTSATRTPSASPATRAACRCTPRRVWEPDEQFPAGVNLEFVRVLGDRHIAMRVYERGVGETQSCGTGTVAAAAAALAQADELTALPVTYRVDVPGGTVEVELGRAAELPDRSGGAGRPRRAVSARRRTPRRPSGGLNVSTGRVLTGREGVGRHRLQPGHRPGAGPGPGRGGQRRRAYSSATPSPRAVAMAELTELGVTAIAVAADVTEADQVARRGRHRGRAARTGGRPGQQRRRLHPPTGAGGERERVAPRDGRQRQRGLELRPGVRPPDGCPAAPG